MLVSTKLPRLESRSAQESALNVLRAAILAGDIPQGSKLAQGEIASQLGVSTTPVREALRVLEAEGLVQFVPGRGAMVPVALDGELEDVYAGRIAIESHVARLAALRRTEDELAAARSVLDEMSREQDPARWFALHRHFHDVLIEACRSSTLVRAATYLANASSISVGSAISMRLPEGATQAQHEAMLGALKSRDPDAAAQSVHDHHARTLRLLRRAASRTDSG